MVRNILKSWNVLSSPLKRRYKLYFLCIFSANSFNKDLIFWIFSRFCIVFFLLPQWNSKEWKKWSAYCCVSWFLGTTSYQFVGIGTRIWQSYFGALCWKKKTLISHVIYRTSTILLGIPRDRGLDLPVM